MQYGECQTKNRQKIVSISKYGQTHRQKWIHKNKIWHIIQIVLSLQNKLTFIIKYRFKYKY